MKRKIIAIVVISMLLMLVIPSVTADEVSFKIFAGPNEDTDYGYNIEIWAGKYDQGGFNVSVVIVVDHILKNRILGFQPITINEDTQILMGQFYKKTYRPPIGFGTIIAHVYDTDNIENHLTREGYLFGFIIFLGPEIR